MKSNPSITAPCDGRVRHGAVRSHARSSFQHPSKPFNTAVTWVARNVLCM